MDNYSNDYTEKMQVLNELLNKKYREVLLSSKRLNPKKIDKEVSGMKVPKNAIQDVFRSFRNEDRFIRIHRVICLWILLLVVICNVIAIFVLIDKYLNSKMDVMALISILVTLLIEILGLLTIIFKYLFNRKENKVLDILSDIIKEIIKKGND